MTGMSLAAEYEVSYCIGNFARAYQIADRHDLRVTVDPYSTPGFTRFYVRRRAYAPPTDTNA